MTGCIGEALTQQEVALLFSSVFDPPSQRRNTWHSQQLPALISQNTRPATQLAGVIVEQKPNGCQRFCQRERESDFTPKPWLTDDMDTHVCMQGMNKTSAQSYVKLWFLYRKTHLFSQLCHVEQLSHCLDYVYRRNTVLRCTKCRGFETSMHLGLDNKNTG